MPLRILKKVRKNCNKTNKILSQLIKKLSDQNEVKKRSIHNFEEIMDEDIKYIIFCYTHRLAELYDQHMVKGDLTEVCCYPQKALDAKNDHLFLDRNEPMGCDSFDWYDYLEIGRINDINALINIITILEWTWDRNIRLRDDNVLIRHGLMYYVK